MTPLTPPLTADPHLECRVRVNVTLFSQPRADVCMAEVSCW